MLHVSPGEQLPPVCVKCATTADIRYRNEKVASLAASLVLVVVGAAAGGSLGPMTRENPDLFVPLLAGIIAVVTVGGLIVRRLAAKTTIDLPICGACDRRWTDGIRYRRWILPFVIAGGLGLAFTSQGDEPLWIAASAILVFVSIIAMFSLRLRKRMVIPQRLRGKIIIASVAPEAIAEIARRRYAGGP